MQDRHKRLCDLIGDIRRGKRQSEHAGYTDDKGYRRGRDDAYLFLVQADHSLFFEY